jgi:hypothetical protein
MTSKLSDCYEWKPFIEYEQFWDVAIKKYPELLKGTGKGSIINSKLRIGIEVEVENIGALDYGKFGHVKNFWSTKPDNSLRNRGMEFVSTPLYGKYIVAGVNFLKDWLDYIEANFGFKADCSDLCGVHIHLNVREFTTEQFASLLFGIMLFESSLFRISGERSANIFCVPMQIATHDLRRYFTACLEGKDDKITRRLMDLVGGGHKYMALNYKPVRNFGTVEFRHAASTVDPVKLLNWINVILHLGEYALKAPFATLVDEVGQLNTSSEYEIYARKVFGDHITLINGPHLVRDMAGGVSKLKTLCIPVHEIEVDDGQNKPRKAKPPLENPFRDPEPQNIAAGEILDRARPAERLAGGLQWNNAMFRQANAPLDGRIWMDDVPPVQVEVVVNPQPAPKWLNDPIRNV